MSKTQQAHNHGATQFKPNTTVAAIITCQNKYLLVEEIDNGRTVYNQPAGHLEKDESLISAIKREVQEETGLLCVPAHLCGIYYYYSDTINIYYLRFCFVIELEHCYQATPQDDDIIGCHWMTLEQIKEKQAQLRSPLVLECIYDHIAEKKIPLTHLKSNL